MARKDNRTTFASMLKKLKETPKEIEGIEAYYFYLNISHEADPSGESPWRRELDIAHQKLYKNRGERGYSQIILDPNYQNGSKRFILRGTNPRDVRREVGECFRDLSSLTYRLEEY